MDFTTSFLICGPNEDFRFFLREMLIKSGFFHVLDVAQSSELVSLCHQHSGNYFLIVQASMLDQEVIQLLSMFNRRFIILAQPAEELTASLAARLGVSCILSFPFSSKNLIEKIQQLS